MSIFTRIKEYREYRKNVKVMKKNLVNFCNNASSLGSNVSANLSKIINYAVKIIEGYEKTEDKDEIVTYTIDSVAKLLDTNNGRIMEFFKWVVSVNQDDLATLVKIYGISKTSDILKELKEKENAENNE